MRAGYRYLYHSFVLMQSEKAKRKMINIGQAKKIIRRSLNRKMQSKIINATEEEATVVDVPRGHFPVYVGECEKRFVIPVSYLKYPSFQMLLQLAEEEFGLDYYHQSGGLRVPCHEEQFLTLTSHFESASN